MTVVLTSNISKCDTKWLSCLRDYKKCIKPGQREREGEGKERRKEKKSFGDVKWREIDTLLALV